MDWNDYLRSDRVNVSSLLLLGKSALHYRTNRETGEPPKDSDAMRFGRMVHRAVLEPELMEQTPIWKGGRRAGKAWGDFCDHYGIEKGTDYLSEQELEKALAIQIAVRSHPVVGAYLDEQGKAEHTILWTHEKTGVECKARLDWLCSVVGDLKTTRDASLLAFIRSASNLRYQVKAAFYREAVRVETGELLPFVWFAVEKDPPYAVASYRADAEDLAIGKARFEQLLERLARMADDDRTGLNGDEELIAKFPPWAHDEDEDHATPVELIGMDGQAVTIA